MPWNATAPLGTVSVKANRSILQDNTTYIQTTMGNSIIGTNTTTTRDHFWNVGANEDGRHRFINSPAFTVGGSPTDAVIGTGMDSVLYAKTTTGRVEWFHRNAQGIYQFMPSFVSGTAVITSSFATLVALPADVYGEIFLYRTTSGNHSGQTGFFKTTGGVCEGWSHALRISGGGGSASFNIRLGNGSDASGLNLRLKTDEASSGNTWNYRITYRTA